MPTDLYRSILNETLAMTGNGAVARAGTSQEWSPSARFRLEVDMDKNAVGLLDTISLPRLNVVVFQGSRREVLRTNSEGETGEYGKFEGSVGFQLNWDGDNFIIWENNNAKRRHSYFNDNTTTLDFVFTGRSLDVVCASLYRAMHAYCYETYNSLNGLVRERRFFDVGLKNKDAGDWVGRYIWGMRRPMALYAKEGGQYRTSRDIMATAFHELGHASHNYKNNTDYSWAFVWERKKMESWAEGISYAFMRALFPRYEASSSGHWAYTSLMECLFKNGFTLEQLQFEFFGATSWDGWRERVRSRNDKPISAELIDLIFKYPNTYPCDLRDVVDMSQGKKYRFQPVTISLKPEVFGFSVENWEIVSGTGGVILSNDSRQFMVYFKESGEKTIRANITLLDGFKMTYEKKITILNGSVISAPSEVTQYYEFKATLLTENYPAAKVESWAVSDSYGKFISKGTTAATIKFTQPGKRKIMAKVRFALGIPAYDCEVDINVKPMDIYSVFQLIDKPATFEFGKTYRAIFKDDSSPNINIRLVRTHHCYLLPYFNFDTWSYDKTSRILSFSIPAKENTPYDYYLQIFYSIEGLEGEQLARLVVSNYRDSIE